ncbi:MAG: hypothetical protein L3J12_05660 [Spirochaetales bacterium]|nr:hypothetical protein [Spirochaetales bacterium]
MKRIAYTLVLSTLLLLTAVTFVSAEGERENTEGRYWGNGMMDEESFNGSGSYGMMGGNGSYGMMGGNGSYGMMGGNGSFGTMGGFGINTDTPPGERLSIDEAKDKVLEYLNDRRMENLELNEIMEFQGNFYAQIKESDTGINAFELLVDPYYGYVSGEPGPNMMWNAKYGPMGGFSSEEMTLTEEDAIIKAGEFLSANSTDLVAEEHADRFYGYYTIHTVKDGKVEGMLSVNGYTGDIWYHSWHGSIVQMEEGDDDHS